MRVVEVYIGLTDHTWFIKEVDVQSSNDRNDIEKEALQKAMDIYGKGKEVAFLGIYSISEEN